MYIEDRKGSRREEDSSLMVRHDAMNGGWKSKLEGERNPNNPKHILSKCDDVIITKRANYVDCVSFGCCISENVYKIFTTEEFEKLHEPPKVTIDRSKLPQNYVKH